MNVLYIDVLTQLLINSGTKLASKPGSPESLQQLVEMVKNPSANVAASSGVNVGKEDKARQSRDKKVSRDIWCSISILCNPLKWSSDSIYIVL